MPQEVILAHPSEVTAVPSQEQDDQVILAHPSEVTRPPQKPGEKAGVILANPAEVRAAPKPLADKVKAGLSWTWDRAWEPLKAAEIEKIPGLEPERAFANYYRFENERAQGMHKGQTNPFAPGAGMASRLATIDRAALKTITDFFSPGQLAMRFTGPLQAVAGAGFTTKQAYDMYENWDRMSTAEKSASIMGLIGGAFLTGHGVFAKGPVKAADSAKADLKPLDHQDRMAFQHGVTPEGSDDKMMHFVDPETGKRFSVPREGLTPEAMDAAVKAHRAANPAPAAAPEPIGVSHQLEEESDIERAIRGSPFKEAQKTPEEAAGAQSRTETSAATEALTKSGWRGAKPAGEGSAEGHELQRETWENNRRAREAHEKARSEAREAHERFRTSYEERLPDKVGYFRYYLEQPTQAMRHSTVPEIEAVGQLIPPAEVHKSQWFSSALKNLEAHISGFGDDLLGRGRSIHHVGEILDRWDDPHKALGQRSTRTSRMFSTEEIAAARRVRVQLLNIWTQLHHASGQTPGSFRLGYIADYLPHFAKLGSFPSRLWEGMKAEFMGAPEDAPSGWRPPEPTTEKRGRGLSANVLRRKGTLTPDQIEYDLRKLMPRYLRGAARVLFDRPAILSAEQSIRNLPSNSTWRQYADAYLDRYAGKSSNDFYERQLSRHARMLMNMGTRAVLGFSPRLQTLHAFRALSAVWPQMATRDFVLGIGKVLSNPVEAYRRAASVGILPQSVPLKYMSSHWQRFDSVANFLGVVDFIDRSIAFEGQNLKYLRDGLPHDQAMTKAAIDAKEFSFMASPAHTPLLFNPGGGVGPAEAMARMSLQYKNIPSSMLYQYIKAMKNVATDPAKAAKFTAALSLGLYLQLKTGARLVHFVGNPLNPTTVVGGMVNRVVQQLKAADKYWERGDEHRFGKHMSQAVELTVAIFVPGSLQGERLRRYGLKSLVLEPSDIDKKVMDRVFRAEHR